MKPWPPQPTYGLWQVTQALAQRGRDMRMLFKAVVLNWILRRRFGTMLALLLGLLVPLALVLKGVGLPLLLVLLLIGAPVFLVLAVVGLPLLLVLGTVGVILGLAAAVLSVGLLLLKIVLPIVLIVWIVRWLSGHNDRGPDSAGSPAME